MTSAAHPGLLLIVGGLLLPLLRGSMRNAAALLVPLAALMLAWNTADGAIWSGHLFGYEVVPFQADKLSRLFAIIFSLMAFGGALFALNQRNRLELPAAFIYAGSAIGVTFAGDLLTVFAFWEAMAIGSTLVLWSAGTPASYRASMRYVMIHLLGGTLLLIGVAGHVVQVHSLRFVAMQPDSLSHGLILAAFLINAGAPPLSAWLADAYPESSWSGMVFLSAFTTKTAVYVLLRGFPGTELLIYVGLFMAMYGIIYALLENDMRRILAYSIVNQVGFMLVGIGIGTEMALNGAAAHAFTHILYKALLLMSAGAVLHATGQRKCTDLGGLFRTMPVTAACGIVGAMAISSFPLTSGFISKSMVSQAAASGHLLTVWLLLSAASAGVFLHAGIKFPWFVFFQKDSGLRPPEAPWNMRIAMLLFAGLCVGLGIWYQPLYALLPYPVDYVPYTGGHVVSQLQLLLFSGLAFFVMLPLLRRTLTISLDVDWLYRVPGVELVRRAGHLISAGMRWLAESRDASRERLTKLVRQFHAPGAIFSRTWPSGSSALWMMALLLGLLLSGYFA
ncbi:MAG: Na(+)/H(+) antiporter subunit D [Ramlibacter sp.]